MLNSFCEALSFIKDSKDKEITLGLDRIKELLDRVGNPQDDLKIIHVAGTNGKGSVCAMTSSILKEAGYRVGLFTSPVILDYREQFQINGEQIDEEIFTDLANVIYVAVKDMTSYPSEFEKCVALALLYFKAKGTELVVLEVGMGGDGDATNAISKSLISIIVNIDYDHTAFLGESLEEIAEKKAGIIKKNGCLILAHQRNEVEECVKKQAALMKADVFITDTDSIHKRAHDLEGQIFDYKEFTDLRLGLLGNYQCENAAIVLEAMAILRNKGYNIPITAIRLGLEKVSWPGRFQIVSRNPVIILDGSHNPHGIAALVDNINTYFPGERLVFIAGILRDKNYEKMLAQMLPLAKAFIAVTPPNPRALPAQELADTLRQLEFDGAVTVAEDFSRAIAEAKKYNSNICAFGSLYSIGELTRNL